MYKLRRYAPLDLWIHLVDSGQAYSIRVVDPCTVVSLCRGRSFGMGGLRTGLRSSRGIKTPRNSVTTGMRRASDNAGVASALKHQGTQALQGALEAPEPWRLHWLQRNVARGRPQSATQPASQTRIALDSGSLAPSRAQRCITASDDSAAPSRTPQQPPLPHLSRHRSLFEDKVQH
jgi:hypothetical protein